MKLYGYQNDNKKEIYGAWSLGIRNVLSVLPTGAGKTVIFSSILAEWEGRSVVIAHRREILGQIAMTLALYGITHCIVGPEKAAREFAIQQRELTGRSWIDPRALVSVASVDTLLSRKVTLGKWAETIGLWVQDEAHHVLECNKWGKVLDLFPNAQGLGVTATPLRTDRKSLKKGRGGVFDTLIVGLPQRELINNGYLADYRIFAPKSDINIESVKITSGGEFNQKQLIEEVHKSHIVGDVIECYRKFAESERGVTFVTDVKTASDMAEGFRDAGIPAAALSAKSKQTERFEAMRAFKNGEILQLVNVDLFGEGFDLPELRVVSFARHTASYGLYCQQFGRVLRKAAGKSHGKIIDHVGNVIRHGLPDRPVRWSLDNGIKPSENKQGPPLRTCVECFRVWESYSKRCPHCDHLPPLTERATPEQVEGDLTEIDPEILAAMRGEVERVDSDGAEISASMEYAGAPQIAVNSLKAKHRKRQEAQSVLRDRLALWGGGARFKGLSESERYMKFYREFDIDVLSAQSLGRPDAESLTERIEESLKQFEGE